MDRTLTTAKKSHLLNGFKVFATAKCMPTPKEFKGTLGGNHFSLLKTLHYYVIFIEIVQCAGGKYLDRMPAKKDDKVFVISCKEDKAIAMKAARVGINVQDKEVLLTGLFKQKLDFKAHALKL